MTLARLLAGCLIFAIASGAQAFVPRAQFILRQATDLAGKGPYQIERTAHFTDGANALPLRESWIVDGENALKVTVRNGNQVVYQALFLNGKKHEAGRAGALGPDFFEHRFVTRASKRWLEEMVEEKVLGADSLQTRPVRDLKEYQYTGDANVRLARTQGTVTFALGTTAESAPGYWFDQDSFQLVRLRTAGGAEARAQRKITAAKGFVFPAQVIISYAGKSVDVQTKSIEPLKTIGKNFEASTLAAPRWDALGTTPLRASIEEFYSRFR